MEDVLVILASEGPLEKSKLSGLKYLGDLLTLILRLNKKKKWANEKKKQGHIDRV